MLRTHHEHIWRGRHPEPGALAGPGIDLDVAAQPAHDAVHGGQAEAVKDGRQSASDPDAAELEEIRDGIRYYGRDQQRTTVDGRAAVVIVPGPKNDLLPPEILALDEYLAKGGRVLFMADPLQADGVAKYLAKYGVTLGNDLVVEPSPKISVSTAVREKIGFLRSEPTA